MGTQSKAEGSEGLGQGVDGGGGWVSTAGLVYCVEEVC